uniref:NADH dehydrogenase [ubiquinone] 1 beta subcomplex subunit 6 n=1 Tax=Piliocolobus tephrosceles TaxID=591936 RepID=A0A8C9IJD2_9PRIM
MTGYTPDEKLRLQQLRELRRRWLKDQELSPREPVLPPQKMWPMEKFWNKFLENKSPWRKTVHGVYQKSIFIFTHVLVPAWIIHYYMKYHVSVSMSFSEFIFILSKIIFYVDILPYLLEIICHL